MLTFVGKHSSFYPKGVSLFLAFQENYIFIDSSKDLNVLDINTENYTFAISLTLLYKFGNAWIKDLTVA